MYSSRPLDRRVSRAFLGKGENLDCNDIDKTAMIDKS